jgi:hypothetical protein
VARDLLHVGHVEVLERIGLRRSGARVQDAGGEREGRSERRRPDER